MVLKWCWVIFSLTWRNPILNLRHCPKFRGVSIFQISLKFKNVSNWSDRGGQHFSNKSQIQKSLKYPIGGGQAYLGHCPKFSRFWIMTPRLRHFIDLLPGYFHLTTSVFTACHQTWDQLLLFFQAAVILITNNLFETWALLLSCINRNNSLATIFFKHQCRPFNVAYIKDWRTFKKKKRTKRHLNPIAYWWVGGVEIHPHPPNRYP